MRGPSLASPAVTIAPQIEPDDAPATRSKPSPSRARRSITAIWKAPRQAQPGSERARIALGPFYSLRRAFASRRAPARRGLRNPVAEPLIPYIDLPEIPLGFLLHVPGLGSLFDPAH